MKTNKNKIRIFNVLNISSSYYLFTFGSDFKGNSSRKILHLTLVLSVAFIFSEEKK